MSSDSSGWKVAYMLLGAVIFVVSLFYLVAWLSWQRCESQHWWLLVIVERRHLFHQNKHGIHKFMHWERDILWKYTVYIYIYICIMTAGFSRWPPHVFPTWHAKRSTHNWCSARSIGTMTTFVITLWTSLAAGSASHLFLGTLEFLYAKKGRVSVGSVR